MKKEYTLIKKDGSAVTVERGVSYVLAKKADLSGEEHLETPDTFDGEEIVRCLSGTILITEQRPLMRQR